MSIFKNIKDIHNIEEASLNKLAGKFSEVNYPKGYLLFHSSKVEQNIYIIADGLVRAYYYNEDKEITFWFGREGDPVLSMRSYVEHTPGYENIELLESSRLYQIRVRDLHELYNIDIEIANWGRKLAEKELLKTEGDFISRQFKTASERYNDLLKSHPDLLQRVQLGYIASYLGITQVTLSRIRADLK